MHHTQYTSHSSLCIVCLCNPALIHCLHFILQLDDATTNEELDAIFNHQQNITLVDASRWSTTTSINIKTKSQLIQDLIIEEIIEKRRQMDSLRKGLGKFALLSICQTHPDKCRSLFVFSARKVTFQDINNLIHEPVAGNEESMNVFEWFMTYLQSRQDEESGMISKSNNSLCVGICALIIALFGDTIKVTG